MSHIKTRGPAPVFIILTTALIVFLVDDRAPSDDAKVPVHKRSGLDSLEAARIPPAERIPNAPKELVAVLRASPAQQPVFAVTFSPSGNIVATGGLEQPLQLWDMAGPTVSAQLPTKGSSVLSVMFTADTKRLLFLTGCGQCVVWQLGKRPDEPRVRFDSAGRVQQQLAMSYATQRFAFDTDNKGVVVYDLTAEPPKLLFSLPHPDGVLSLSFSANGQVLASGTADTVYVWDMTRNPPIATAAHSHPDGVVDAVAVSHKGTVVAGSEGRTIRTYSDSKIDKVFRDHQDRVIGLGFVGGDAWPLLSADAGGRIVLRTKDDKRLMDIKMAVRMEGLALSRDGRHVATGNRDGTIYILRLPVLDR